MLKLTNSQQTLKFLALLAEGLPWIDAWTPTDINAGGCGSFAALLSDKFTEQSIEHEIVVLYFDDNPDSGEKALSEYLQNGNQLTNAGEDHIVIKIMDYIYLDSKGIVNDAAIRSRRKMTINRTQLQALVDHGRWNPIFDRSCIPKMKELVDEVFEKFEVFEEGKTFEFPEHGIKYTAKTIEAKRKANPLSELLQFLG